MEEKEIWKDIVGYEGLYQISNFGNVKSLRRYIQTRDGVLAYLREKIIRPSKDKNGYYFYVKLSNNGKQVKFYIHRLVATAFLEKPEGKNYIDHINTDYLDNRAINLKWCTQKENQNNPLTKKHMSHSSLKERPWEQKVISMYSQDGVKIRTFKSTMQAHKETGINNIIRSVQKGIKAGGYYWKYD